MTKDAKTLLKGGVGRFYDRVPLLAATFPDFPDRTVTLLGENNAVSTSTFYENTLADPIRNPRSTAWNLELDREVTRKLLLRFAYEQRHTTDDFVVSPITHGNTGTIELSNAGSSSGISGLSRFEQTRSEVSHNTISASRISAL